MGNRDSQNYVQASARLDKNWRIVPPSQGRSLQLRPASLIGEGSTHAIKSALLSFYREHLVPLLLGGASFFCKNRKKEL